MTNVITTQEVRDQLLAYLNRHISLSQLVDWAEQGMQESSLEEEHADILRDVLARIGLSDVKSFGLSWDDCYDFLARLGYHVKEMVA